MDAAAHTLLKKTALILAIALAIAAPGMAQQLQVTSQTVTLTTTAPVNVGVTSSTGATASDITFTIAQSGTNFFNVFANQTTTPATLTFQVSNSTCATLVVPNCTGTVTLTPSVGTAIAISVGLNSGGGNNNSILVSPTNVSLAAVVGGVDTKSVTISTGSASPISISTSGSPVSWLSLSQAGSFVSVTTTASITFTASAVGLANNTLYQTSINIVPGSGGSISVPVNFCVGACSGGGGGGGGSGSMTVSQQTASLSYPTGTTSSTLTVGSSNVSTTSYSASVTSGSWLSIAGSNGVPNTSLFFQPLGNLTLSVNSLASTLGTGVFTGTVVVNPGDSSGAASVTITVTLTVNGGSVTGVNLSQSSITFTQAVGGTATLSQAISASTTSGTTVNIGAVASTTSGGSWLSVGINSSFLPATITAFTSGAVTGSLAQGTYTGNIALTYSGGVNGTQNIPVTLVVGNGGGGGGGSGGNTTLVTNPGSLVFSCQIGGTSSPCSSTLPLQILSVNTTGSISATATVTTSQQWLQVVPSGSLLYIYALPNGLPAGSYTGTVGVTTAAGLQNVGVTLNVLAGAVVVTNPGSFVTSFTAGGSNPSLQTMTIGMSDGSSQSVTVTSNQTWVTAANLSGTNTPATYGITINPSGLASGVWVANLSISASGAANSPAVVPIVLTVTGGSSGNTNLTFTQSSLTFSAATNGSAPAAQTLGITSSFSQTGTVGASTSNGGNWLSISPSGSVNLTTSQTNFSVGVNQSGLANGTYNGQISVTANGSTATVPVTLVVSTGGGSGGQSGNITVSPNSLTFSYQTGASAPDNQVLRLTNDQGLFVGFTATVSTSNCGNWLSLPNYVTGLTTTFNLTVAVNTSALTTATTCNGNIAIQPNGGTLVNVPVTLTVTSQTVSTSPASGGTLTFTYRAGDSAPQPQTINVSGGGGTLGFSASASSTGGWLSVSPTSGTTPATGTAALTVSVNGSTLNAGNYNGTITVSGTGGATGNSIINVALTVTVPPPTITSVVNAASFIAGRVSPGEIVTLQGTAMGPTPGLGLAIDPTTGKVSTLVGGVQVLVSGFPAPLTFVSATQINAVIPYEVKGLINPFVQVKYLGQTSNAFSLQAAAAAPGIFSVNFGTGPAAALNQNNSTNGPGNPANKGDVVVFYLTGEGDTSPPGVTGKVTVANPTAPFTPTPLLTPGVTIDGLPASFIFAGEAPNFVSGVLQLNVTIPSNARSGDLPVVVTIGGSSTQSNVTVSVR